MCLSCASIINGVSSLSSTLLSMYELSFTYFSEINRTDIVVIIRQFENEAMRQFESPLFRKIPVCDTQKGQILVGGNEACITGGNTSLTPLICSGLRPMFSRTSSLVIAVAITASGTCQLIGVDGMIFKGFVWIPFTSKRLLITRLSNCCL